MLLTSLASVLTEASTQNASPNPILIGLTAGGILVLLLIIVTRFNKDR
jgi:hypothetical protein